MYVTDNSLLDAVVALIVAIKIAPAGLTHTKKSSDSLDAPSPPVWGRRVLQEVSECCGTTSSRAVNCAGGGAVCWGGAGGHVLRLSVSRSLCLPSSSLRESPHPPFCLREAVSVLIASAPLHYQGAVCLEWAHLLTSHLAFRGQFE